MVDISDDTNVVWRRTEVTRVVRRWHWGNEEKGRIVAEAIAPGAVIADVARRHDLAPQHLSNWIKAAEDGRFVLPATRCQALCLSLWRQCRRTNPHLSAAVPSSRL